VVAKPDPERGQVVKAFVVCAPGSQPSQELARELQEHCHTVTAPYKYPHEVEFTRVELREREQAAAAD
jgi:acyl-coenzyme A synthetase/AMP-(fatty) acid ligase